MHVILEHMSETSDNWWAGPILAPPTKCQTCLTCAAEWHWQAFRLHSTWPNFDQSRQMILAHHSRTADAAVRSVTLNLANKFSQCTFSDAEHYDLFSDLIILRQASWRRSYDVIHTDLTEPTNCCRKSSTLPYRPEINLYASHHALHDETTI